MTKGKSLQKIRTRCKGSSLLSRVIFIVFVAILLQSAEGLSDSIVLPTNPNFRTGIVAIVQTSNTSSYITTGATSSYMFTYGAIMPTASLNSTLGIMSCNFPMDSPNFGWDVTILTLDATSMII
jgi:hypothetical protein